MTAIIITVIISVVMGVAWAHSIAETDPDEIERKYEHETD